LNLIPTLLIAGMLGFVASVHADNIDDLVQRAMASNRIPGLTLAVIKDGKPVKVKAYGLANIDYDIPTKTDTPFLLASMTKSFTAASVMMLVEQGKIDLDAPISKYLEDTPEAWKGITVRHLLSHTAGLKDRFEEVPFNVSNWKINYPIASMYKTARETPVDFKPGESFQYSDQGFFLLGMLVEQASGMKYPDFLKSHIFDPLGMKDSSTVNLSRIVKGMASGYGLLGGALFHNSRRTDYGMVSHFGMISTVDDLAKWDAALDGEKLLKRSSIDQMWTASKLANGSYAYTPYGAYGLGWFVDRFNGHRSVGHGGSTGTAFLKFPDDKLTVIVLTNLEQLSGGDATGIAVEIARNYLPAVSWESLRPIPDPQPTLAANFKASMETMAAGKFDESLYNSFFGASLKPTIPSQKQGLSALGSLDKIECLELLPWGTGHLGRYRTTYKLVTVYATALFDPAGKIAFLQVEAAHKYR